LVVDTRPLLIKDFESRSMSKTFNRPLCLLSRPPYKIFKEPLLSNRRHFCTVYEGECYIFRIKPAAGLRSVARNNKATRLLTRPGWTTKSSAKDLILHVVKLQSASKPPQLLWDGRCWPSKVLGQRPIRIQLRRTGGNHPVLAWILT
jgi:hypothetical protein